MTRPSLSMTRFYLPSPNVVFPHNQPYRWEPLNYFAQKLPIYHQISCSRTLRDNRPVAPTLRSAAPDPGRHHPWSPGLATAAYRASRRHLRHRRRHVRPFHRARLAAAAMSADNPAKSNRRRSRSRSRSRSRPLRPPMHQLATGHPSLPQFRGQEPAHPHRCNRAEGPDRVRRPILG